MIETMWKGETVLQIEELIKLYLSQQVYAMSVKPGCFHQGNCKQKERNNLHETQNGLPRGPSRKVTIHH